MRSTASRLRAAFLLLASTFCENHMAHPPPQPPARIIDLQLPLTWLLSSVAAIIGFLAAMVWSVAGQSNKLDQLIMNTAKLEKRVDERDSRLDMVKEAQYELRRVNDGLAMRVDALERSSRK